MMFPVRHAGANDADAAVFSPSFRLLLEHAKASGVPAMELWCLQGNTRARRFYEVRGFRAVAFTDGTGNKEKTPDVRYRWEQPLHGATCRSRTAL